MAAQRNLEGPIIDVGQATKYLVFFLHGWGSDGKDLIQIGEMWKNQLNTASLISPNGPEVCTGNPSGRQWFDILNNDEEQILKGLQQAYLDIKKLIAHYLVKYNLKSDQYFLVGFSQGTMLALYTALREKLSGVIGYSGAFLGNVPEQNLPLNDYLLLHGKNDSVVPIEKMYKAKGILKNISSSLDCKAYDNLEHSINEEGLQAGLHFIRSRIEGKKNNLLRSEK